MRISLNVALGLDGPQTLDDIVDEVQGAADAGLAGSWWSQLPYAEGVTPWDALTTIAAVGSRVGGVAVGTSVAVTHLHHPLVLAGQALTAQAATGNRLTLGLGVSHAAMLEATFGLGHGRPARHIREYLTVLAPALRGEPVDHTGEEYTARGTVRVPHAEAPSVLVAALGPAMLAAAGELADGTITAWAGPRALGDHVVPRIARAAERAGRPAPRVVAGLPVCVTDQVERARQQVSENLGAAADLPSYRAILDAGGAGGVDEVVMIGDEDEVARQVARLEDAGATELVAALVGSAAERARTLALLRELAARQAPAAT